MSDTPSAPKPHPRDWRISLALAGAVLAVYWQVGWFQSVGYDDPGYIAVHPEVTDGLSVAGVRWAFSSIEMNNWQPLVWLSYMLDVSLFGPGNAAHHLVNVVLHIANTILLFLVLKRMTGARWPSAVVAALFALHPLHVESVAWISERKDVLSTLFWMLTMGAYARYAARPSLGRYVPVFAGLALGLMAKPMLVTLPFVLLLLDFWPLGRLGLGGPRFVVAQTSGRDEARPSNPGTPLSLRWVLLEKVPLLALAAASSVVTYWAQWQSGVMSDLPLEIRLSTAVMAYVGYLGKMVWPSHLSVVYPYGTAPAWPAVAVAAAGLILVTVLVVLAARRRPYLAVGWFWFVGTLVPVSGIVQVGVQTMADRYTYVPLTGLFIAAAWLAADLVAARPRARTIVAIAGAGAVAALTVVSFLQVQCWRDSEALFRTAAGAVDRNYIAENNLAVALLKKGNVDKALGHAILATNYRGDYAEAHCNVGLILLHTGHPNEAAIAYGEAIRLKANFGMAHAGLADVRVAQGLYGQAIEECGKALAINPGLADAEETWGRALQAQGKGAEAVSHYAAAIRMAPGNAGKRVSLALCLVAMGDSRGAVRELRLVVALRPDAADALNALAWILATDPDSDVRNGDDAILLATGACDLTERKSPSALDTLAAAYAERGRFKEAVDTARAAEVLAIAAKDKTQIENLRHRLDLYRAGKPFHTEPVH